MKTIAIATFWFLLTVVIGVGFAALFLAPYLVLAGFIIVPVAAGIGVGITIGRRLSSTNQ
ncbi:hypothetical protein ACRAWC_01725 [Leifsonia sp. L25]|uniref:hypothetical protein n=1 Tax=Actinomycetes TaxID=1760 RepID=UPI003D695C0E